MISALRPGLKTGVENYIFWSEIGSGFGEPGVTPQPRIPRSTPGLVLQTNPRKLSRIAHLYIAFGNCLIKTVLYITRLMPKV